MSIGPLNYDNRLSYSCSTSFGNTVFPEANTCNPTYFNQHTNPLNSNLQSDKVELSTDKKSSVAKTALTVGAIAGLVISAIALYKKGKPVKLAEHIDFTPAKTVEEALTFTKKHLGIKKVDKEISDNLDVMNWINEALAKVNNATKGKATMPTSIRSVVEEKTTMASMKSRARILSINKAWIEDIDRSILEHQLNELLLERKDLFTALYDYKDIMVTLEKFKNNQLSFNEKIALQEKLHAISNFLCSAYENPKVIAQRMHGSGIVLTAHDKSGKVYETVEDLYQYLQKLPKQDRCSFILEGFNNGGTKILIPSRSHSEVIAHEIGHLEHYRNVGFDKYQSMRKIKEFEKLKKPVSEITKDFINSEEKQCLAERISHYAKSSPLEYVAEVYSRLIDGEKLSKEIMDLYYKYGGPKIFV